AATMLFAGCISNPEAEPSKPAASSPSSSEPSQTPTQEPAELIDGGTELFPDRRFVGLYDYPGDPALGALGEQGPKVSAQCSIELSEVYEPYSNVLVYPAFVIIATVDLSYTGAVLDYFYATASEKFEAYVDATEANYV